MVLARDQRVSEMLAEAEEKDARITALQQDIADKESAMIELSGELRSAQEEVGRQRERGRETAERLQERLKQVEGECEQEGQAARERVAELMDQVQALTAEVQRERNLVQELREMMQRLEDAEKERSEQFSECLQVSAREKEKEEQKLRESVRMAEEERREESAREADVMGILQGQLEQVGAVVEQVETQCCLLQATLAREQLSRQQCERQLEEALHQVLQVEQIRAAAERERELERVHEKELLETSLESACCERSRIQADCDGSVPPSNPPHCSCGSRPIYTSAVASFAVCRKQRGCDHHIYACICSRRYVAKVNQQMSQTVAILARTEALLHKKERELQIAENDGLQRQVEVATARAECQRLGAQVEETANLLREREEELQRMLLEHAELQKARDEAQTSCTASQAQVLQSAADAQVLRETASKAVELSATLERELATTRAEAENSHQALSAHVKRLEEEMASRSKAWDDERDAERDAARQNEAQMSAEILKLTATLDRMKEDETQKEAVREREREREAILTITSRLEEKDRECQRLVVGEHDRREREKEECERELARTREELAEAVERSLKAEARAREGEREGDRLSGAMQEAEKLRRESLEERQSEKEEAAAALQRAQGREKAREEELETLRDELKTRDSRLGVLQDGKLECEQRLLGKEHQLLQAQQDLERATRELEQAQHTQAKLQEQLERYGGTDEQAQLAAARAETAESKRMFQAELQRLTQENQVLKDQLTGPAHLLRESVDKMAAEMALLERERAAQALQVEMAKMREQEARDQREKECITREQERARESEARERERLEWERERAELKARGAEALERISSLVSAQKVLEDDLALAVSKGEALQAELVSAVQAHDSQLTHERQQASEAASAKEVIPAFFLSVSCTDGQTSMCVQQVRAPM